MLSLDTFFNFIKNTRDACIKKIRFQSGISSTMPCIVYREITNYFYFMKIRSREPEFIDLGSDHYTQEEYYDCLYQLGRIGNYLGNNKKMLKIFAKLPYKIDSILDVGCGGGLFALQIAEQFKNSKVIGIDLSLQAINYANQQKLQNNINNLEYQISKTPELNEAAKSFDIVTATLVCHHLSDSQIIDFLKRAKIVARKNIIINDLHRNIISYLGATILIPLFFNNRLVKNDSLLSIKKSFIRSDWVYYLNSAGFKAQDYSITWHWPFRWIIKVNIK